MEVYELVKDLISTFGFPIAVCCYLFWKENKQSNTLEKAIENNTNAVAEVKTMITTFMDYMAKMNGKRDEE